MRSAAKRVRPLLAATPDLREFRSEVRSWLRAHLAEDVRVTGLNDPTGASGADFERRLRWQRTLHGGGWVGVHWPVAHGGRGASLLEYAIYLVEHAEAGAPEPVNVIGLNMVGPTLIAHGTREQQLQLPDILSGDRIWAQLFSEPDAGSDLTAVSARAQRIDGAWVISGQKVWISWGLQADLGLLLARTGGPGLGGLSCFIVPMDAPGITVRGIRQMSGETHFSEVFFDDVVLPPGSLVGSEGEGWKVATSTLTHERTTAILSRHASTAAAASFLVDLVDGRRGPHLDRAMDLWVGTQTFLLNGYRGVVEAAGDAIPVVSYTQRLQWGVLTQRIFELGIELLGIDGGASLADDEYLASWRTLFTTSRGWTIGGGTSEIQRNMLGEKILGLPREPRAM